MNRVHFSLTDEELKYIDKLKEEKNCTSRNKAFSLIINEHKNNSDITIKSMYQYMADRIAEQLKDEFKKLKKDISEEVSSEISPNINKLRYATNSVSKDTQILLQLLNGIYYKEDYGVVPDVEKMPQKAYTLSVERVETKIAKEHYKNSDTFF